MSPEEVKLLAKTDGAKPQLKGTFRRLLILGALFAFLCALLKGVSTLARLTVDTSDLHDSAYAWGCPPDARTPSFHDKLWCNNLQLINAAYDTDFIHSVLDGSLDASAFDARQIQDAYWEKNVAMLYKDICQNTDCTAQLSQLFEDVSDSYAAAAKEKLNTHRTKLSEITPTNGSKAFVAYLESVARTYPVNYNAIAIASSLRLRVEIAKRLKANGAAAVGSHSAWIEEIIQTEAQLNRATSVVDSATLRFDEKLAQQIYNQALKHNIEFFKMVPV